MKNLLEPPTGIVNAVLDTDTYNEIDDQYALAYFLLSKEKINPLAVYAAPFSNVRAETPAEGMEKSYEEILRVLPLCGREGFPAYRGSTTYLPDEYTPVESEAARDLVKRALEHSPENPLYVLTIGAITNVASALLMVPAIRKNIVVVWLGGQAHSWPILSWAEFNMVQDIAAARVVFNSGCALVQMPCMGTVSHLTTTGPELREHMKGKSPLGNYLYEITCDKAVNEDGGGETWSRVIWDISVVAWLMGEEFVKAYTTPAPVPSYDNGYLHSADRHAMKVAFYLNRDAIFLDLFKKLRNALT
ncbi:MAG: nucleoside hydrolase [Defluviitaleaceae bacterium]|nr:nucleoside hydrolase [Defluviitaleaceae bacterium]MCL2273458.1 nucleoside hydrolase [Defluviitaleaceae bacterium]